MGSSTPRFLQLDPVGLDPIGWIPLDWIALVDEILRNCRKVYTWLARYRPTVANSGSTPPDLLSNLLLVLCDIRLWASHAHIMMLQDLSSYGHNANV